MKFAVAISFLALNSFCLHAQVKRYLERKGYEEAGVLEAPNVSVFASLNASNDKMAIGNFVMEQRGGALDKVNPKSEMEFKIQHNSKLLNLVSGR
jgi:hypothetical protein